MTGDATAAPLRFQVVVPALNEGAGIEATLASVIAERRGGCEIDCVVVDGGSGDDTCDRARRAGVRTISAPRGRAVQCNAGAASGDADVYLFVHADTILPAGWSAAVAQALAGGRRWGRFDVRIDDPRPLLRVVSAMINLRSRLTGIATGDQCLFVAADAWQASGGFARIPLMEDVELCRRMKRLGGRPACLALRVRTSARRWQRHGAWHTIVLMWWIRWLYFVGVSPRRLHGLYYGGPK